MTQQSIGWRDGVRRIVLRSRQSTRSTSPLRSSHVFTESLGTYMRAMFVTTTGGPEVLQEREAPDPSPGPGEIAIAVAYAGVNFAEVMARRGDYSPAPVPFIPGFEVSGRVAALGDGVTTFFVGQLVAAMTVTGGYAEIAIASAVMVVAVPAGVDLRTAAAFPTIAPTAYALLVDVARVRAGETIVVHAAAGGVGTVVGQMARLFGASRVFGTVGSAEKIAYTRRFGYDSVFVREGWVDAVRNETGGRGVDVVLDSVGGDVLAASFDALAPLGRVVVFGNATASSAVPLDSNALWFRNVSLLTYSIGHLSATDPARVARQAQAAMAMIGDGRVHLDITDVLPLSAAATAHRRLEGRLTTGKLLLAVGAG